jgi:hypothetical protein
VHGPTLLANGGLRDLLEPLGGRAHEVAKLPEQDLPDVEEQRHPSRIDDATQVASKHEAIETAQRPDDQVSELCDESFHGVLSVCEWSLTTRSYPGATPPACATTPS